MEDLDLTDPHAERGFAGLAERAAVVEGGAVHSTVQVAVAVPL
ncbi:hypothetical protein [Streptomyces sp. NPDC018352]